MKLSAKQALVMFDILKWSTTVYGGIGGYSPEYRLGLLNDIINQQNDEIIDLSKEDES